MSEHDATLPQVFPGAGWRMGPVEGIRKLEPLRIVARRLALPFFDATVVCVLDSLQTQNSMGQFGVVQWKQVAAAGAGGGCDMTEAGASPSQSKSD